jgi:hypothetical protein
MPRPARRPARPSDGASARLSARVLAPILCLCLTAPAPAVAGPDAEDALKILGGLALIYVVGREIERRRDGAARPGTLARRGPVAAAPRIAPPPAMPPAVPPVRASPIPAPRPAPAAGMRLLPEQCWAVVEGPVERRGGYDADCTRNAVARPSALPARCLATVGGAAGARQLYDAACLVAEGWQTRVARR